MKKINNKGFVISSILYTLLISFLLMLALLLLQFKSSSDVINNASKDLVNGEEFKATQLLDNSYVSFTDSSGNLVTLNEANSDYKYKNTTIQATGVKYTCIKTITQKDDYNVIKSSDANIVENAAYYWYEPPNKMLVRINSRYGTVYWPKDFDSNILIESENSNNIPNNISCASYSLGPDFSNCTKTYKNIKVEVDFFDATDGSITLKITDNLNSGTVLKDGVPCTYDTSSNNCITLSQPSTGC